MIQTAKNRLIFKASALLTVALMFQGCMGYKIGSTLPADMRSIYIPTFVNDSQEPLIEVEATNAAIAEFQRDGTLRIVGEDMADLILECRLTGITLDPLRYSRVDRTQPNEYRLTLNAFLVLKRGGTGQILSRRSVSGESTFVFTGNLLNAKKGAMPDATRDLARRIVENVVEAWW